MCHMVQKSDNDVVLEIILNLLRKTENHVRGIAKELKVSHTTISRKVTELLKDNVLDYKREGKNKIFNLKKTFRTKNYVYMAENYKINKLLRKYPELSVTMKEVIDNTGANLIMLFGSYASFNAKADSDIDIFIETKNRTVKEKLQEINRKLSVKIGDFDLNNNLVKEIIKNHVILKGVEIFYEKTKFFE